MAMRADIVPTCVHASTIQSDSAFGDFDRKPAAL